MLAACSAALTYLCDVVSQQKPIVLSLGVPDGLWRATVGDVEALQYSSSGTLGNNDSVMEPDECVFL